jgi:phosphoglycolate phosphatase
MQYSLALFDLDGTLFDSFYSITKTLRLTLREWCGLEVSDLGQLRRYIGPPLADTLSSFGLEGARLGEAVGFYRRHYYDTLGDTSVYPGIPELLSEIKAAGCGLAIASSKATPVITRLLERNGLFSLFDFVAGLEDSFPETKSQIISRAVSACGSPARSKTVMVGDRFYDAAGAADNAIAFAAAGYGFGSRNEFAPYPMAFYAATVGDLRRFLTG